MKALLVYALVAIWPDVGLTRDRGRPIEHLQITEAGRAAIRNTLT